MNTKKSILRLAKKARQICESQNQYARVIQHPRISESYMSTNVSISQIAKEKETFQDVLPGIIGSLVTNPKFSQVPEIGSWVKQVLDYNLTREKNSRGLTAVYAYDTIEKPENITEESLQLARTMGWCVEMFHTHQLLLNDIMEGEMRSGVPCWYKRPDVGLDGVYDASIIQSAMYTTLREHFRTKPYYKHVLETFNVMLLKCSMGHYVEKQMLKTDKPDLTQFTMEKYKAITKYKMSYYTFQLPVSVALLMAGIDDPETHRQAETILLEMGEFFQIQDDFLECFGDPSVTGNGTGIEDGKCTWLAVVALQRANAAQKQIMEENYGRNDPGAVAKIKNLYEELQLPHTYSVFEETTYDLIRTQIQQITRGLPHDLFFKILDNILRRSI